MQSNYPVTSQVLSSIVGERDFNLLQFLGGASGLAIRLGCTNLKDGLSTEQAEKNRAEFGRNELPPKALRTFLDHLIEALEDKTLRILIFSAVCSILFGAWPSIEPGAGWNISKWKWGSRPEELVQGFAIVLTVAVVSGINSFQNWHKDKEFESLNEFKENRLLDVLRPGQGPVKVQKNEIAVGDVLVLFVGERLPADGILISGFGVEADQSASTGESEPVSKTPDSLVATSQLASSSTGVAAMPLSTTLNDCLLVGGSMIKAGSDIRMLVTAVGQSSEIGKVAKAVQRGGNSEDEDNDDNGTPLQKKLTKLADDIGKVGMGVGVLTFLVLTFLWMSSNPFYPSHANPTATEVLASYWTLVTSSKAGALITFFIVGVSIVVVAVPEGLPLAVTISLAFSMRRMMKDNNFVRELMACETMGSATIIASDKTGTLTANRMTVTKAMIAGSVIENVKGNGLRRQLSSGPGSGAALTAHLFRAISLNTDASLKSGQGDQAEYVGSATEGALLHMLVNEGEDYERIRIDEGGVKIVARRPFTKESKLQTCVVRSSADNSVPIVYVTGAFEVLLPRCSGHMQLNGEQRPFHDVGERDNIQATHDSFARNGLRVLAIAFKRLDNGGSDKHLIDSARSALEWHQALHAVGSTVDSQGLTLLGLFGIEDPLREGVPAAVSRLKDAGLRILMVTGDNVVTAQTIALQAGILTNKSTRPGEVMEGKEFRTLDQDALSKVLLELKVLARCSPTDKLLLVKALQATGEVVAVTGDGINDAPALAAADIGLSMGIAGTEVAKEASKIVILDDNFASIVATVRWGRSIKENIRKFLNFQITINIVALSLTFITACMWKGGDSDPLHDFPIKPVQLLWINMLMDSFAALMLATEPPTDMLMKHKPQGQDEPLITAIMAKNMIGHAFFQLSLLLWLTLTTGGAAFFGLERGAHEQQLRENTLAFNVFVCLQIFNLFNCRSVHDEMNIFANFSNSSVAQVVLAIIVVSQVFIIELGGSVMQTEPLSSADWAKCVFLGSLSLPMGYFLRILPQSWRQLVPILGSSPLLLYLQRLMPRFVSRRSESEERTWLNSVKVVDVTSDADQDQKSV
jgi:P-type Ca2+ transporter type 2C